jgi:hypothetical protein
MATLQEASGGDTEMGGEIDTGAAVHRMDSAVIAEPPSWLKDGARLRSPTGSIVQVTDRQFSVCVVKDSRFMARRHVDSRAYSPALSHPPSLPCGHATHDRRRSRVPGAPGLGLPRTRGEARDAHGDAPLIGEYPDMTFHSVGVGVTWEAAFADERRRREARNRGEVIRGRWEWRGDELWLTATCPCGEQATRVRLTGPVDGETWARAEIAEWMARERWKRSCPHVAQWDWRAERRGIRR